jgi:hypothetical protein
MNDQFFNLAACALEYVSAHKRDDDDIEAASFDLAGAALAYAAAPKPSDPAEFDDCCFG